MMLTIAARKFHLAAEGVRLVLLIGLFAIASLIVGLWWLTAAIMVLAIAVGSFFRDPERLPERLCDVVLSGADGRVTDIGEATLPWAPGIRFSRIAVFMSPLNVHVNRASVSGEVIAVEHTPGDYRAAFRDHACDFNERNTVVLQDGAGRRHALTQIAGYFARRIICRLRPHDKIQAGQRIGLIMFGSRVDHYLPPDYRICVKISDRVRAGETVIGELVR